jgi:hypothetical protein
MPVCIPEINALENPIGNDPLLFFGQIAEVRVQVYVIFLLQLGEVILLFPIQFIENCAKYLIAGPFHREPVKVVHIDFVLHGFVDDINQLGLIAGVALTQLVLASAEETTAIRDDEAGRELATGFTLPGILDVGATNAVTVDDLMALRTSGSH